MIELNIIDNGDEIDWKHLRDEAVDSVLKDLAVTVYEDLQAISVHEHPQEANVILDVEGDTITLRIENCCCAQMEEDVRKSVETSLTTFFPAG